MYYGQPWPMSAGHSNIVGRTAKATLGGWALQYYQPLYCMLYLRANRSMIPVKGQIIK